MAIQLILFVRLSVVGVESADVSWVLFKCPTFGLSFLHRVEVPSPGIVDTPENLWSFYISRVRKNLHMSLCFSPVGDGLWSRARRFPALVNCTTIDWLLGGRGVGGSWNQPGHDGNWFS